MSNTLIKNKTFQALLGTNIAVIVLTIFFSFATPFSIINFEIHASGWTSIAALVLGDYLGIKAIQAEQQIQSVFGNPDVKAAILHLDRFITGFEEFTSTPEGLLFIQKLVKGVEIMEKLTQGVENGNK